MCGSMRPMNRPIFRAKASISRSVMARGTGPGFSSRVSRRSVPAGLRPGPLPADTLEPADLPGYRLIHSVKSQMQWGRWFAAAGRRPETLAPRAVRPQPYGDRRRRERDRDCARERSDDVARIGDGALVCPLRRPPPASRVTQWLVCPHDRLRQRRSAPSSTGYARSAISGWPCATKSSSSLFSCANTFC